MAAEDRYRAQEAEDRYRAPEAEEDLYTAAGIGGLLRTRRMGRNLVFLEEVDSTNLCLRRLAAQGAPEGTLAAAEEQTAGKGRRGRSWFAPRGTNIYMSFLLRPEFPPERASMLTLVAALAVAAGIRQVTGLAGQIKWPNDLVLDGKKICGILTEMSADPEKIRYVIVGIGINVNQVEFPEELRKMATSLRLQAQRPVSRGALVAAVAEAWEDRYERFLTALDMGPLLNEYNSLLVNRDREVEVLAGSGSFRGVSRGINEKGELLVETEEGRLRTVMSGEVSVRGIYGYV